MKPNVQVSLTDERATSPIAPTVLFCYSSVNATHLTHLMLYIVPVLQLTFFSVTHKLVACIETLVQGFYTDTFYSASTFSEEYAAQNTDKVKHTPSLFNTVNTRTERLYNRSRNNV